MMSLISIGLFIGVCSGQGYRVYDILGGSNDWYEANEMCLDQGFDGYDFTLATIYTDDEYEALIDLKETVKPKNRRIKGTESFWVGLYLNAMGEFVWADGTPCERDDGLCVNDWVTTPDLTTTSDYCVSLSVADDGSKEYSAGSCDTDRRYVCSFINGTTPAPLHDEDESIGECEGGDTYSITGSTCVVSGDPHFTTWAGQRHDYQGNPHILYDDFYYVAPCYDATPEDLPFTIIGHHWFLGWSNREVTSLDYLTFELFKDSYSSTEKYEKYYLWLSSHTQAYIDANKIDEKEHRDNPSYDYHKAELDGGDMEVIAANTWVAIGDDNKFKVKYTLTGSNLEAWLMIDGTEEVHFTMRGYYYYSGRNRGHSLYLDVPTNYRCFICGLCGDFKRARIGSSSDKHTLITCQGGLVEYQWGWMRYHPDWQFPYDLHANTWGFEYVAETCPIYDIEGRKEARRRLVTEEDYVPDVGPDFVFTDPYTPCSNIKSQILAACATARDGLTTECDTIGVEMCDDLQADCGLDVCVASGNDADAIDGWVQEFFTDEIVYRANPAAAHAAIGPFEQFEPFGQDESPANDVAIETSSKWIFYGGLLLVILLTVNFVYMCYLNTSQRGKTRYSVVKFADSEYDDSEAAIKN